MNYELVLRLYTLIKSYSLRKIKSLNSINMIDSSKEYHANLDRIRRIKSLWITIRIIPDTLTKEYVRNLFRVYKLIHQI